MKSFRKGYMIAYILLAAFQISCKSKGNNQEFQRLLLQNQINLRNDNTSLILLTQYDCMQCTSKILSQLLKLSDSQKKIVGIYYGDDMNGEYRKLKAQINDRVEWYETTTNDLFLWSAELSRSKAGPYLIQVKDRDLLSVEKLN